MITFKKVSKTYSDGTTALNEISFQVPKGQFCVILGQSGAGKSTILRLVNGLEYPSGGRVEIDGLTLEPKTIQLIRRKVSMVHQEFNLSSRSSVAVNVMSGALVEVPLLMALIGWFPAKIRRKCCELVERVGLLEKHLKRRVSQLSGGQQQRVGIARSLMLDPLVILADEPIASLDPSTSRTMLSSLKSIAKESGCTILCCLHQVDLAKQFSDRIIGIDSGQIVFDLVPAEVDEKVLKLIYENYRDPLGDKAIKSAEVDNFLGGTAGEVY